MQYGKKDLFADGKEVGILLLTSVQRVPDSSRMAHEKPLQQLFDEFAFECEYVRKLKPKTLHAHRSTFNLLIKLLPDLDLELINSYSITSFFKILAERQRIVGKGMRKTGIKKSTVATYWSKLNVFFEWLYTKGHIAKNPFGEMAYPTPTYDDRKFLKREDVEKILTAILKNSHNALILKRNLSIFYIFLFCGLRKEELLSLQVRDIDLERKMLTVRGETSKSGKMRSVPLHSQVILHLKDYLKERKAYTTQYLFVSSTRDERLTVAGLKYVIDRLRTKSGIQFHAHQLRHTFAVNFLQASNNIAKLKQLLGHTSISMTLQYVRCLPPNKMREDIEGLNIDMFV